MTPLLAAYLACLAPVPPAAPADGVYTYDDGPGPRVQRNDGAEVALGKRVGTAFGEATLTSVANDNSRYVLQLKNAGPLGEGAETGRLLVIADGVILAVWGHSDPHPDRTMDLSCTVQGDDAAARVAARLKVERRKRKHPGHRFAVRWVPEKESFAPGEAVTLRMELKNTGTEPFTFAVGGKQRGPRDNQFRFLAYRGSGLGKAVPDTGDPTNFGGITGPKTLRPGETFTKSVTLDKWFTFAEPDVYRVTGLFELELLGDPASAGRPVWDDLAAGECLVRVTAKP